MNEKTRVTETRFGIGVLAGLIELKTSIILISIAWFTALEGYIAITIGCFVFASICMVEAFSIKKKGYAYQFKSLFGKSPEWTINDIDLKELRENGEVVIYE